MRTLWNIVSFMAVVHLLALVGFVVWLWNTDRLNVERVHAIRDSLAITITDEQAAAAEAERLAKEQLELAKNEALMKNPPVTSAAQIELITRIEEQSIQAQRRLQDEHARLMAQLEAARADVQQRETELDAQKAAWIAAEKAEQERKLNEQFTQVVRLLESIPAKLAKAKIRELIDSDKTDQAVAYLDAMNGRAAAAIIREFKSPEENRLATELLERLRTFGLPADVAEDSPSATSDSDAT